MRNYLSKKCLVLSTILLCGISTTALADSNALAFAIQAGTIAGTAQACGGQNVAQFSSRADEALRKLSVSSVDYLQARTAYANAMQQAQATQMSKHPIPCMQVNQDFASLPLMRPDYQQTVISQLSPGMTAAKPNTPPLPGAVQQPTMQPPGGLPPLQPSTTLQPVQPPYTQPNAAAPSTGTGLPPIPPSPTINQMPNINNAPAPQTAAPALPTVPPQPSINQPGATIQAPPPPPTVTQPATPAQPGATNAVPNPYMAPQVTQQQMVTAAPAPTPTPNYQQQATNVQTPNNMPAISDTNGNAPNS